MRKQNPSFLSPYAPHSICWVHRHAFAYGISRSRGSWGRAGWTRWRILGPAADMACLQHWSPALNAAARQASPRMLHWGDSPSALAHPKPPPSCWPCLCAAGSLQQGKQTRQPSSHIGCATGRATASLFCMQMATVQALCQRRLWPLLCSSRRPGSRLQGPAGSSSSALQMQRGWWPLLHHCRQVSCALCFCCTLPVRFWCTGCHGGRSAVPLRSGTQAALPAGGLCPALLLYRLPCQLDLQRREPSSRLQSQQAGRLSSAPHMQGGWWPFLHHRRQMGCACALLCCTGKVDHVLTSPHIPTAMLCSMRCPGLPVAVLVEADLNKCALWLMCHVSFAAVKLMSLP